MPTAGDTCEIADYLRAVRQPNGGLRCMQIVRFCALTLCTCTAARMSRAASGRQTPPPHVRRLGECRRRGRQLLADGLAFGAAMVVRQIDVGLPAEWIQETRDVAKLTLLGRHPQRWRAGFCVGYTAAVDTRLRAL